MQKLQKLLAGRYGGDAFNIFLLAVGLVFSLAGGLFFRPLYIVADALYVYALFRIFSRNIPARQRENQAFYRAWGPVQNWFSMEKQKLFQRKTYKYFKCPQCKQQLRAPRGRGKIEVTCQRCHHVFQTKT